MKQALSAIVILVVLTITAYGAAKPRPYTGNGLLVIRDLVSQPGNENFQLPIYLEPGVGRIAEFQRCDLPKLSPVIASRQGECVVPAMRIKGDWLKVPYDEAGREGWLRMERSWEYTPWEIYLKGKAVRLLPGLRKNFYALRPEPNDNSPTTEISSKQQNLRVIQVRDDWALVLVDLINYGWIRWRDDDGRFLIAIEDRFASQRH